MSRIKQDNRLEHIRELNEQLASRDAEVAELRNDVKMMREHILSAHVALSHRRGRSLDVPSGYADDAQSELEQALSATKHHDRS